MKTLTLTLIQILDARPLTTGIVATLIYIALALIF